MKYSIDMIRFRFSISYIYIKRAVSNIKFNAEINASEQWKNWTSTKPFGYRYNITQNLDDTSIYIGIENNSDKKNELTGVMEFNPNKINIWDHKDYMDILKYSILNDNLQVMSFDIAIDFDKDIKTLTFVNPRQSETIMKSPKGKTHYFGKSRYNGFTRVYDKASEQGQKDKTLTRYEIRYKQTLDYNDIQGILELVQKTKMVKVTGGADEKNSTLNKNQKAVLFAVKNGYDIKELSRRYQKIIRDELDQQSEINIKKMDIYSTYIKYIDDIQSHINFNKHEFRV